MVEAKKYLPNGLLASDITNNSDSSFQIFRWWLENCQQNYKACSVGRAAYELPTRLLDLGQGDTLRSKLCLSKDLHGSVRYATLSHCWGNLKFITLTRDNLENMLLEIPVGDLTRTFREAMEITKRLGCRYLWVDSLCIIQDDYDWRTEAAKMSSVYQNSFFNIAAVRGPDGQSGCFAHRDLQDVLPCRISTSWDAFPSSVTNESHKMNDVQKQPEERRPQSQGQATLETIQRQIRAQQAPGIWVNQGVYVCHSSSMWSRSVDKSILKSRGWVTQELVLSPRVLYFGKTQVFWECKERRACETLPGGIFGHSGTKLSPVPNPSRVLPVHGFEFNTRDAHGVWDKVVQLYSAADLTYPAKDKLLAIGGVANALEIDGEYLAGLWENDLPRQLLWAAFKECSRLHEYQAPTWSWASLNGLIPSRRSETSFHAIASRIRAAESGATPGLGQVLIRIIQARTKHKHPKNRFGPVESGEIVIRSAMFRPQDTLYDHGVQEERVRYTMDVTMEHKHPTVDMYCLPILITDYVLNPMIYGLLLLREANNPGAYRRCGIFDMGIDRFRDVMSRIVIMDGYDGIRSGDHLGVEIDERTGERSYIIVLV